MEATLYNQSGDEVGTIQLDEYIFGIEPNVPVMHQVMVIQQANARREPQHAGRGEVRGGPARCIARREPAARARAQFARRTSRAVALPWAASAQVPPGDAAQDAPACGSIGALGQARRR